MNLDPDTTPKCRVLIVDDDQKVRALLSDLLEAEGYTVMSVTDGGGARDSLAAFEPDVVISDVVMPVLDGIELCRHIKNDPATSSIPVLLISGVRYALEDSLEGLTAGADDYLNLPFRNEELLVKVARLAERHRAHRALRASEDRYRQLVELSPEAIVIHSEGILRYLNPAAQRLWGAEKPEQLVGRSILDRVHPDYHDTVKERVRQVEEHGSATNLIEQKHVRLDGTVIDVEVAGMPFVLNGEPAVQVVMRDTTDRNRGREALRQTETQLRTVIGSASLVLFVVNVEGVCTLAEGEGLKNLNLKPSDLVGHSVFDVYRDNSQVIGNIRRALKGEAFSAAVEVGSLMFETRYSPLFDDAGKVTGVIGVATDVTDNRKAQNALQENEERYRELFENANDLIYTHDLSGNFTSLNRSGERLTGYSREEAMRMNIADVVAPDYLSVARHMMGQKTNNHGSTVYELEILTKAKRRLRLELSTRLIHRDGKAVGVQGIGRDLTERKRSEEALAQQAQREAMTNRISQAIRCSLDSSEIFHTAVNELGSHLKADRCSLFIKDERTRRVRNVAEYHSPGILPAATDFGLEDVRQLSKSLEENGVLCFDDAAHEPGIADFYSRILSKAQVRSIMYVAIRVGDEVSAAFALSTTREIRHWSETDIALAKAVADQTGIAIRQAELYQTAEATSKREVLVNRLTMTIRASLSLAEVLSTATRELGAALSASRVHMRLYDAGNPVSAVAHEYVAPHSTSLHDELRYDSPFGRQLLNMSGPLVISDCSNYQEGPAGFSAAIREYGRLAEVQSQIVYPIIVKEHFRGVLCIHQTDRLRVWTENELSLVTSVAERLAIGIAQAELFEMVAKAKTEWETTFDSMSDGIFIFDPSGHLKRVNRAGAAMENSDPRALLGSKCCDILRTSAQNQTCVVEKAIEEGSSIIVEVVPDQLNRPILVSIEPVLDDTGAVTAAVCTARDLSELRKVQAVAREHQSLLTNILESARESIYAVDVDGRFKWCNSATLSGLGYEREEFIGTRFLDMVYEADREVANEKMQTALNGQAQTYEMRYFAADGGLRYARVDNSPLIVEGRTTGVLGIARDITEQKEERERAARADKLRALGQLASGVAHDFNNSLAAILGRAQLLRRQTQDEALVRNLEIIQTAAEDAAATVRRIQTFARKSPAREFERLEVGGLLNDAVEITRTRWQNEARSRGLEYDVSLNAGNGLFTFGSASELREVFVNLIVNAVDAMPNGGRLKIDCVADDSRLRLTFADTGTGMPEDVRQKIFDPFFTTKGAHGTGLGLSVSYSIIERHEGSISVASRIGEGTVFTIELPASRLSAESSAEPANDVESPKLSILVIDDEPSVRETLAEMLELMGHRVVLADSGQSALQLLSANECELVFTDLAMPDMDGWETSREIRKRWPDMHVVLVTGYGSGTLPPKGEDNLVNGIIGKPFDFSQINQTITKILANEPLLESMPA
ncbi:MAG TPA: PAS domain S-box protein [Pyrinomonadaceae bacterium]|nr:PAS domain S-box protein [Pyrinomonadaceae bacterium]